MATKSHEKKLKVMTCIIHELYVHVLTLSLPKVLSSKLRKSSRILFCKIVKNKQHHLKVLLNSFHLNGDKRFDSGSERVNCMYKVKLVP